MPPSLALFDLSALSFAINCKVTYSKAALRRYINTGGGGGRRGEGCTLNGWALPASFFPPLMRSAGKAGGKRTRTFCDVSVCSTIWPRVYLRFNIRLPARHTSGTMRSRDLYAPAGIWDDRLVIQLLYDYSSRRPASLLNLSGMPNRRATPKMRYSLSSTNYDYHYSLDEFISAIRSSGIERGECVEQTWISYVDSNRKSQAHR